MKYPAACHAHWSSGPVPCCQDHAEKLVKLGDFMGIHVPLTKLPEGVEPECTNCINENKKEAA